MIYAVIDTNVFVSSFLTRHSDAATVRIVRSIGTGAFVPLYNEDILTEYREVLSRPKFRIVQAVVLALIAKLQECGLFAESVSSGVAFPDEDDRVFYEVALSHVSEGAKLVTGNLRHFPQSPIVLTAQQFCELIGT